MSVIKVQSCKSNEPWHQMVVRSENTPGAIYTVTVPFPDDPPDRWSCSCRSFLFRGYCKHCAKVKPCRWDANVGPERQTAEQEVNHICPRCSGPTFDDLSNDHE